MKYFHPVMFNNLALLQDKTGSNEWTLSQIKPLAVNTVIRHVSENDIQLIQQSLGSWQYNTSAEDVLTSGQALLQYLETKMQESTNVPFKF